MIVWSDTTFPSENSRFAPLIFVDRSLEPSPGSSTIELPCAFAEAGAYPPEIEHYQALRESAPCLLRATTLPKGTKLELGRGAHLGTSSSAKHTAAASQPTDRIAKAASWLHLSRASPALHPPERPSHTHTSKPCFRGRGHEVIIQHWYRGMPIFPVRLTTSRIGNLTRLIHTLLYVMTIHTYIQ